MTDLLYIVGGRRGVLHISAVKSAGASTPPPTVSSIIANEGPIGGGLLVVVGGTNLAGVTACTIGGVPCTSVTPIDAVSFSCITPALTAGAKDVVATTPGGTSAPLVGGFTAFDIATLGFTGWFRASFPGGTSWAGTASAGSSGARTVSEATNPATAGIAVNGFTPASFNGTTKFMADATAMSSFAAVGSGTFLVVAKTAAIAVGSGTPYDNPAFFADVGANLGLHLGNTDKLIAYSFDGAAKKVEVVATANIGVYTLYKMRWNGVNLEGGINAGWGTPTPCGNNAGLAGGVRMGRNYAGLYVNSDILEVATLAIAETDANINRYRSYLNCRYGISV